jgi:hypothetical protein
MKPLFLLLVLALLLSSCAPAAAPPPTETPTETPLPTPSDTPVPADTATPEPTSTPTMTFTPEPTATPTITPTATRVMGEEMVLLQGGFSFRTPVGFRHQVFDDWAILYTADGSVLIKLDAWVDFLFDQNLLPELAEWYLEIFNEEYEIPFTLGEPVPHSIAGIEGLLFPLDAGNLRGEMVLVEPNSYTMFFVVAIWATPDDMTRFEKRGKDGLQAVLDHIVFFE